MSVKMKQIIITCQDTGKKVYEVYEDYFNHPESEEESWDVYTRWFNIIRKEALSHGIDFWKAEDAQGGYWSSEM